MRILVDTNVLLRMVQESHPNQAVAEGAVLRLHADGHDLCIVPQVIYEYWVVATRPVDQNGLGMTTAVADLAVDQWQQLFLLLRDERAIYESWRELVVTADVKGKNAHDARLVAAMRRHGLSHLVTFNQGDFSRFSAVTVLTPAEVVAAASP